MPALYEEHVIVKIHPQIREEIKKISDRQGMHMTKLIDNILRRYIEQNK